MKIKVISPIRILYTRGFGATFEYGSLGTEYQDSRQNMVLSILVYLWRPIAIHITWKR